MDGLTVASLQEVRRNEARMRLLRYLPDHPDATTRQIAADLGVSNGAAYYLLKALLDEGLVKTQTFANSKSKTQYVHALTPDGISQKLALMRMFLYRKQEEYKALAAELNAMNQELRFEGDAAPANVSDE